MPPFLVSPSKFRNVKRKETKSVGGIYGRLEPKRREDIRTGSFVLSEVILKDAIAS